MPKVLRVAVLSDVHAGDAPQTGTFVVAEPPMSRINENPLRDLCGFVRDTRLNADLLLCPGDLGNQASSAGQLYGWNMLTQIAADIGANELIATVGNHDVVTHTPVPDSAQLLKNLVPGFPTNDPTANDMFWNRGFYLDDSNPDYRLLNINSCADFLACPDAGASESELDLHARSVERGSVTLDRIRAIEAELRPLPEKVVNLVLLHHHPVEHARSAWFRDEYGPMVNGDELLEMLERNGQCGRWMVVHGHKHIPTFTIDGGSSNSPLMLCAASVGGALWQPISSVARNQFHIIEFEIDRVLGLPLTRGLVRSWAWSFGTGWCEAPPTTGLPASFGFGSLHDSRDLADQVVGHINTVGVEFMKWSDIELALPLVRYIDPLGMSIFEKRLESRDFLIERFKGFEISRVARSASW